VFTTVGSRTTLRAIDDLLAATVELVRRDGIVGEPAGLHHADSRTHPLDINRWHVGGTPSARCGTLAASDHPREPEEVPMAIVGGLDTHRRQITYDILDTTTGETRRGQLSPASRLEVRAWLAQIHGQPAAFALEATTGWRYLVKELERAGCVAHLAEPADTRALRGPKRRAKTDRTDARHLRELLRAGTLPESWIPPAHVADARTQVRLRHALVGDRTGWYQRIHAVLFHHGLPDRSGLLTTDGRAWLASIDLPVVARQAVDLALRTIDHLDEELDRLDTQLTRTARAQPGCQALQRRYGIGRLTAVAIWAEFGDVRRFANARQAVRFTGLDVTISESDGKRARGHLARQGSPVLRWALHEAATCAARPASPDHAYYLKVKQRLGGKRAALSVARKLAREAYHTLHELGDQALVPAKVPAAA
jgi:transposase